MVGHHWKWPKQMCRSRSWVQRSHQQSLWERNKCNVPPSTNHWSIGFRWIGPLHVSMICVALKKKWIFSEGSHDPSELPGEFGEALRWAAPTLLPLGSAADRYPEPNDTSIKLALGKFTPTLTFCRLEAWNHLKFIYLIVLLFVEIPHPHNGRNHSEAENNLKIWHRPSDIDGKEWFGKASNLHFTWGVDTFRPPKMLSFFMPGWS